MSNKEECGYYNKICIYCSKLSKISTICVNGHINVNLKDILKYDKDYEKNIQSIILIYTGISSETGIYNKSYKLLIGEYKKCISRLHYVKLDYNHTNPFLEGTAANTIFGETKPRQLIYPFHNIIKDVTSTDTTINENNYNKNVELFVKSFQILECISTIARIKTNENDSYIRNIINKLIPKIEDEKCNYLLENIIINSQGQACRDNTLNDFTYKIKLDIKEKKCNWLIYSITLVFTSGCHQNILIVNMLNPNDIKMFYFEPHGFNKKNIGYKICFNELNNLVTSLAIEYNSIPNNTRKITLGPETFINKPWQTNEPFCATWCLFFMSIVLLNPNLSMVNIYELFKIEHDEIRYLLLYRFLFWFCNFDEYKKQTPNNNITYEANQFISSKELNNTLTRITIDPTIDPTINHKINSKNTYHYCKSFVIHGQPYINGNVKMLKNVFAYKDNLTKLSFVKCSFNNNDIYVLKDLDNLTKLSIIQCNYSFVSSTSAWAKIILPKKLVELEMRNNDFNEFAILSTLPELVKYVYYDFPVYKGLMGFFKHYTNKILQSGLYSVSPIKVTLMENDELERVIKANNHVFIHNGNDYYKKNRYRYFYKNPDELPNYCLNCKQNNDSHFDNAIEEKWCVKCNKILIYYPHLWNRIIKFS